jgi:protocatechuate 3,4-dioxygenase beta subunit
LLRLLPLTLLSGEDDEWHEYSSGRYQNKCFSEVLKDENGADWTRGRIFTEDGGKTWFSSIESHVPITFPFDVPDQPEKVYLNSDEQ